MTEAVKGGELWKLWYTFVPKPEDMRKEIDRRLGLRASGSMLPWTVFDADGKIAGMTTYMNVDAPNRRGGDRPALGGRRGAGRGAHTQCKNIVVCPAVVKIGWHA